MRRRDLGRDARVDGVGLTHIGTLGAVSDLAEAVADIARVSLRLSRLRPPTRPRARVFLVGAGTSGGWRSSRRARRGAVARATRPPRPEPLPPRRRRRSRRALPRVRVRARTTATPRRADFRRAVAVYEPYSLGDVVVVGPCGLSAPRVVVRRKYRAGSAPYVAEALERALDDSEGFNLRRAPPRGGFRRALSEHERFRNGRGISTRASVCLTTREREAARSARGERLLINPILGPEAIAGSTRMKGGTATKLVLDAAFAAATVGEGAPLDRIRTAPSLFLRRDYRPTRDAAEFAAGGSGVRGGVRVHRVEMNAEGLVRIGRARAPLAPSRRADYVRRESRRIADVDDKRRARAS